VLIKLSVIRPNRSTMYVDAACGYRLNEKAGASADGRAIYYEGRLVGNSSEGFRSSEEVVVAFIQVSVRLKRSGLWASMRSDKAAE